MHTLESLWKDEAHFLTSLVIMLLRLYISCFIAGHVIDNCYHLVLILFRYPPRNHDFFTIGQRIFVDRNRTDSSTEITLDFATQILNQKLTDQKREKEFRRGGCLHTHSECGKVSGRRKLLHCD